MRKVPEKAAFYNVQKRDGFLAALEMTEHVAADPFVLENPHTGERPA